MHYWALTILLFAAVFQTACVRYPEKAQQPPLPPEDVLQLWQGFIDQDMYDSARVYSAGEALEFVNFLYSITDYSDPDRVMSITLLRDLACQVQGDSAVCAYVTKDEIGQDVPDTVILRLLDHRWKVWRVYGAGEAPPDTIPAGDVLFPGDSVDEEYQ
ncbi:MAG: hypothetical protein RL742_1344 [Bacteroidota bacterium]|jgi:hypothetical protein